MSVAALPPRAPVERPVVVVPTYNERENLPALAKVVLALPVDGLRLLVVDDNSPDGTGTLADEIAAAAGGRMPVLHRPGKGGLGPAYRAGFAWALANGADAVVEMDADFSHDPAVVPALLAKLQTCDLALGSRYVPGGGVDPAWSAPRRLLSRFGGIYASLILGLPIHDPTGGFRAYRRAALEAIDLTASAPAATLSRSRWPTPSTGAACACASCRSTSRTAPRASRRCRSASPSRRPGASGK